MMVEKLFRKNIYVIIIILTNRTQIPKMAEEKKVKRGDFEFLYSKIMVVCEWADSCSVLVFSNALEDMNYLSSVKKKRVKRTATKFCSTIVKQYNNGKNNNGKDEVDIVDK